MFADILSFPGQRILRDSRFVLEIAPSMLNERQTIVLCILHAIAPVPSQAIIPRDMNRQGS